MLCLSGPWRVSVVSMVSTLRSGQARRFCYRSVQSSARCPPLQSISQSISEFDQSIDLTINQWWGQTGVAFFRAGTKKIVRLTGCWIVGKIDLLQIGGGLGVCRGLVGDDQRGLDELPHCGSSLVACLIDPSISISWTGGQASEGFYHVFKLPCPGEVGLAGLLTQVQHYSTVCISWYGREATISPILATGDLSSNIWNG